LANPKPGACSLKVMFDGYVQAKTRCSPSALFPAPMLRFRRILASLGRNFGFQGTKVEMPMHVSTTKRVKITHRPLSHKR